MTVYTEDTLVQQTTVDYLEQQLKWESVYAYNNEDFGPGNLLGRASDREVVLTRTLREKLEALNPSLPVAAYDDAVRTQGMRYFIKPTLLQTADLALTTSLKRIEPHRLQALVMEDISRYPGSSSGAVNRRIGPEISYKNLKRALDALCLAGKIRYEGTGKGRKYWVAG